MVRHGLVHHSRRRETHQVERTARSRQVLMSLRSLLYGGRPQMTSITRMQDGRGQMGMGFMFSSRPYLGLRKEQIRRHRVPPIHVNPRYQTSGTANPTRNKIQTRLRPTGIRMATSPQRHLSVTGPSHHPAFHIDLHHPRV